MSKLLRCSPQGLKRGAWLLGLNCLRHDENVIGFIASVVFWPIIKPVGEDTAFVLLISRIQLLALEGFISL